MSFATIEFLLFTALIVLLYFILPKKVQWIVLLVGVINTELSTTK